MKTMARAQDKEEIVRRLRTLRADSARRWGRMSAHQMICHLSDSFLAVTGQRHVSPASGPLQRTVIKWIALYAPFNWPQGVPTRPEVDQESGGTKPSNFAADVTQLEMLVELITTRKGCFGPSHPIFGNMSETAWMRWAYLHMDHHLRQFGC
jgi:Protein of unknown function (DUF1569)